MRHVVVYNKWWLYVTNVAPVLMKMPISCLNRPKKRAVGVYLIWRPRAESWPSRPPFQRDAAIAAFRIILLPLQTAIIPSEARPLVLRLLPWFIALRPRQTASFWSISVASNRPMLMNNNLTANSYVALATAFQHILFPTRNSLSIFTIVSLFICVIRIIFNSVRLDSI